MAAAGFIWDGRQELLFGSENPLEEKVD